MKTLTQIVLPIAALAGLVFVVTFISNYTANPRPDQNKAAPKDSGTPPLKFVHNRATRDPNVPSLSTFRTDYEVGEEGHFDFWFQNPHPQPVRVSLKGKSCTCTSAELGIVPAEAWERYLQQTAVNALPGVQGRNLLLAAAFANLAEKVQWQPLDMEDEKNTHAVPAASSGGPQMGVVRLGWKAKEPPDPKRLTATVLRQLPETNASPVNLEVLINVVPAFRVYVPGVMPPEIRLGDFTANVTRDAEFVVWSTTRPEMDLSVTDPDHPNDPCVRWTKPERLTPDEAKSLETALSKEAGYPLRVRSAYRVRLTVAEQRDGKQLDLGPLDRRLTIAVPQADPFGLPVRGMVRGEVRVVGGPQDRDRIDLGASYPSNREKVKQVLLVAERPDLRLELLKGETSPDYLEPTLEGPEMVDGKPQWKLRVRIPPDRLFGSLPPSSAIVLQTQDANKRRIRIPVQGQTYAAGQ